MAMQKITHIFLLLSLISCKFVYAHEIVYLFAHGLYTNQNLASYYARLPDVTTQIQNNQLYMQTKSGFKHMWPLQNPTDGLFWIIKNPFYTFNFPDALRGFDGNQTSLAQENEIQALANEYEKIKQNKVVLVGMSRGASTILNFLGTRPSNSVIAAVIESPFDSIIETLNTLCKIAGVYWVPSLIKLTSPNLFFGKYDSNGIFPIKVAHNINKDIPLLIIASLEDTLIPAANSASIYQKLRELGHEHVYLLLLNKGSHGFLLENDDALIYISTVHAFYKKYNLPYNQTFATQGDAILMQCQPTKTIVDDALKNKKTFIKV
jgi:pimeloyl-ACP methyl ester carboxylesterase